MFNNMFPTSGAMASPMMGQMSTGFGSNGQTMLAPGSQGIAGFGQNLMPQMGEMGGLGGMGGGAGQGWFSKIGGMEGLGSIAQGLASLGQVYGAIQGNKMAKEQMNLSKEAYSTNLANTTKSYNTNLEDRVRARYAQEGRPANDVNSYLAKHSM